MVGSPGRPARKRPERYHHGNLRRALVQQAVRTIQKRGIEGLTLRAVSEALGVSRTALYRHFADKSALLTAVAREGFRTLRLELLEARERGGHGREGFDAMGLAYVRFAVRHPAYYRVMFGGFVEACEMDPELLTETSAAFQVLVDALVAQQEAGLVRRDEPLQLARFIWATVHGIAMLAIDGQLRGPDGDVDGLIRFATERIRSGIAAVN
ncbi:MAG: TetR/AcrR family transcriptional regulator [Vicinamibacterales bacterium]